MNYEQILQAAKDEVARKNGWKDWDELFRNVYPRERINLLNEAAILAMQRVAEQSELETLEELLEDTKGVHPEYFRHGIEERISIIKYGV